MLEIWYICIKINRLYSAKCSKKEKNKEMLACRMKMSDNGEVAVDELLQRNVGEKRS